MLLSASDIFCVKKIGTAYLILLIQEMLIANGYEVVPPREVVDIDIDELFPKQS